jgi:hypothetical protein
MHVACFMLDSFLDFSSTLEMEATSYSETPINFQRATRCYTAEDMALQVTRILNVVGDCYYLLQNLSCPSFGR